LQTVRNWGPGDALVLLAAVFGLTNIFYRALGRWTGQWDLVWRFLAGTTIQTGVILLLVWLAMRFYYRRNLSSIGLGASGRWDGFLLGVRWGPVLFLLVSTAGLLVQVLFKVSPMPQPFTKMVLSTYNPIQLVVAFLMGVVLAPIGEEVLFRGVVFPALKDRLGAVMGIIISSLMFGVLHADPLRLVPLALGGAFLAVLYQHTSSLYAPIAAHGVWNGIMLLMLLASRGGVGM